MNTVIVWIAPGLLWMVGAAWVAVWILVSRRDGLVSAGTQVVTAVVGVALMLAARVLRHDPRPFGKNPAVHPVFPHAAADGLPSDQAVAAGAMVGLVAARFLRRRTHPAGSVASR